MKSDHYVAWINNEDDITENKAVADNWVHHGSDVKQLDRNALAKYRAAICIRSAYECSECYLTQTELDLLKAINIKIIGKRKLPMVFCEVKDSFAITWDQ